MTKKFLQPLAIAALAFIGSSTAQAQTILELSYPSTAPGSVPCLYTTNGAGISANPQTGNLVALGDFSTGCPQTGQTLPLPVIVPGPSDWLLPDPWLIGQNVAVQWAAVNADTCVYGGSTAAGWPSSLTACSSTTDCQTLKNVNLSPPSAGLYQFSLTCTNATGSRTSTSVARNVSANPPVITAGPSVWNVSNWTAGTTRPFSWSTTNANNCTFSAARPQSVALESLFTTINGFPPSCSSVTNTCAASSNGSLELRPPQPGQYSVSLTCSSSSGGSTTSSTQPFTVSQGSSQNCLSPAPGWNRLEQAEIAIVFSSGGFHDVTQFASIWGRNYAISGAPIQAQWPGVGLSNQLAMPIFGMNQYIAAKFSTPAGRAGHTLYVDTTTFANAGGGVGDFAKFSATVSTVCGDFNSTSASIPASCKWSQQGGNSSIAIFSGETGGGFCNLAPNTEYYLNLIYAPLTSPASANFNGVSNGGPLLQNQNPYSN